MRRGQDNEEVKTLKGKEKGGKALALPTIGA